MRLNKKLTVLFFIVLFFGIGESVSAATYYVANTGNDNCSGTAQTLGSSGTCAWKTLAKVNGRTFSPGDSILFKRGDTWNERLIIPSSGTAGNPITFGAYGTGNKPVFDGTGVVIPHWRGLIFGDTKNYITVTDIRVQNSGIGIGSTVENYGIGFYGGTGITVQNCEVYNVDSYGIFANTSSNVRYLNNDVSRASCYSWGEQITVSVVNGFEIAYNKSHDDCPNGGGGGGSGIDAKGGSSNGTIHHNEVYNLTTPLAVGIYVDAWDATTHNVQVYNNYVHNIAGGGGLSVGAEAGGTIYDITFHHNIVTNAQDGFTMHDEGTTGGPVYNIYFYNNTLYLNGKADQDWHGGVRILDSLLSTGGVTFKNNIIANSYNYQIGYYHSLVQLTDIVANYNVIYGINSGGYAYNSGTNTITSNPLFVNAAGNNFTLQSGSPARNACDNSVWQGKPNITDYNGVKITDSSGNLVAPGGRVDCGAIEYGEGTGGTDTIPPSIPTGLSVQ